MDKNARLQQIISRAKTLPFYQKRLAAIQPQNITVDTLQQLPLVSRENLTEHFKDNLEGGFYSDDIVQVHLTPAPHIGRMPEFMTANDVRWQRQATAKHLRRAGITEKSRCLAVFSYHMLAGGWLFHEALQEIGASVLALGPAKAEEVIEIAQNYHFDVLVSNPSFAKKLGAAGATFDVLIAAGEPFTAVPDYREQVESALGCKALDAYGLSETGIIAAETSAQDGLHIVEDACILEVLDSETLEPVADGKKGELVVTSLTREGMPILRFRTGDLTLKGSDENGNILLPRGVFGRTDTMVKVKGVKFYPKELLFILAATPDINFRNYQVVVESSEAGTDMIHLLLEGQENADTSSLASRIRSATGIGMNSISVQKEVTGELLVDKRY